jgi:hypothetical protein
MLVAKKLTPHAHRVITPGGRPGRRVSISRGAVLPATDGTDAGEEHKLSQAADIREPASELERQVKIS